MRFLGRPTFRRMLSVLPKLRSSVHGSVHRRRHVVNESSAVDDSGSGRTNLTKFRSRPILRLCLGIGVSLAPGSGKGSGQQGVAGQFRGKRQQAGRTIPTVPSAVGPVPTSPIPGHPQSPAGRRLPSPREASALTAGGPMISPRRQAWQFPPCRPGCLITPSLAPVLAPSARSFAQSGSRPSELRFPSRELPALRASSARPVRGLFRCTIPTRGVTDGLRRAAHPLR